MTMKKMIQMRSLLSLLVIFCLQCCSIRVLGFGIPNRYPQKHTRRCSSNQQDAAANDIIQLDRREWLGQVALGSLSATIASLIIPQYARAAPPISVIAEELGYFPVTNKEGQTTYVPARARRESSDQAIALAKKLSKEGVIMYGAFWCPHCKRQKELFGRQAWQYINYVECSSKGYGAKPSMCLANEVDGYPTWIFRDKTILGGERELSVLATKVKTPFNPKLEQNVPPPLGSTACKQQQ